MLLSTVVALSCVINYRRHLLAFRSRRLIGDAIMSKGITMQQEFDFLIANIKKELAKTRKQMDLAKQQEKSAEMTKLEKRQKELIHEKQRLWQSRNFDKVYAIRPPTPRPRRRRRRLAHAPATPWRVACRVLWPVSHHSMSPRPIATG